MFDVFFSYKSEDWEWVYRAKRALEHLGLRVWLDRDQIRPGDLFPQALERGMEASSNIVVVMSKEALESKWVQNEYYRALQLVNRPDGVQRRLIPVLLRDVQVPGFLGIRQYIDFRDQSKFDQCVGRLYWGITGKLPEEARAPGADDEGKAAPADHAPRLVVLFSHPLVTKAGAPLAALDTAAERQVITNAFRDHRIPIHLCYDIATTQALTRHLLRGCDWLHLSGHGAPGALAFEDGCGRVHQVADSLLKTLIETDAVRRLKLAVVSACYSEHIGQALTAAGVPHVVAIELTQPVLDQAAVTFARDFYGALAAGRTVRASFASARAAVLADPRLKQSAAKQADRFVLLPKDRRHRATLCSALPVGPPREESEETTGHNLHARRPDFVGRAWEMHRIISLLANHDRLVTVRGAPGIGKTEAAIEVGRWLAERRHFPDGIRFVDLRKVPSAEALRGEIALAFQVRCEDDQQLARSLAGRECLVILDNLEDPMSRDRAAVRDLIALLLQRAPRLKLLVTSHEPIGGGMPVPEQVEVLTQLGLEDSAKLFAENSQERSVASALEGDENFLAIFQILGGHPLALTIVATHHPVMSLSEIREALAGEPDHVLAIEGVSDVDRGALNSVTRSLDLSVHKLLELNPQAVRLLGILSLLPAGALPEALSKIADFDYKDALGDLVRHSLAERGESGRVTLLPVVLLYAARHLSGEDRDRCGLAALQVLSHLYRSLLPEMFRANARGVQWVLAAELPNALACLGRPRRARGPHERVATGATLASDACDAAVNLDRLRDAGAIVTLGLESARAIGDRQGEANCLLSLGGLRLRLADLEGAQQAYDEALPLYREIGERLGEANTLRALGYLRLRVDDVEGAQQAYDEALPLCREIGGRLGEANTLRALGELRLLVDDLEGAQQAYDEALPLYREIGGRLGEANCLLSLGDLRLRADDLEGAQQGYDEALPLYREIGGRLGEANTYDGLGRLGMALGKPDDGVLHFGKALAIYRSIGDRWSTAKTLLGVVRALSMLRRTEEARAAVEEAERLAREIDDAGLLKWVARARRILGE